jgi:hypothetical protein
MNYQGTIGAMGTHGTWIGLGLFLLLLAVWWIDRMDKKAIHRASEQFAKERYGGSVTVSRIIESFCVSFGLDVKAIDPARRLADDYGVNEVWEAEVLRQCLLEHMGITPPANWPVYNCTVDELISGITENRTEPGTWPEVGCPLDSARARSGP